MRGAAQTCTTKRVGYLRTAELAPQRITFSVPIGAHNTKNLGGCTISTTSIYYTHHILINLIDRFESVHVTCNKRVLLHATGPTSRCPLSKTLAVPTPYPPLIGTHTHLPNVHRTLTCCQKRSHRKGACPLTAPSPAILRDTGVKRTRKPKDPRAHKASGRRSLLVAQRENMRWKPAPLRCSRQMLARRGGSR